VPDGDDAIVRTRVTLKPSWEVDVDHRMAWQGTRWMISDVLGARTSLARNFRSQFDSVIWSSSYEELVSKVGARLPWTAALYPRDFRNSALVAVRRRRSSMASMACTGFVPESARRRR